MPRIQDKYIEDLKAAANDHIVDIIESYGIKLKKVGKEYSCLCCFHDDQNHPSMTVSETEGAFHCKTCDEGGYAFQFVEKYERLDFPAAVAKVAKIIGFREVEYEKEDLSPAEKQKIKNLDDVKAVLNRASAIYCGNLSTNERGLRFAVTRGVTTEDVHRFQIGYAPDSYDSLKNHFVGYTAETLHAAGLLGKTQKDKSAPARYYDFQRDRLIFPIRNLAGDVVSFGGRALQYKKGQQAPKYLNGAETEVFAKSKVLFGLYESTKATRRPGSQTYNVVEGYLDVVASHRAGLTNTVAPLGTAISSEQLSGLFRYADQVRFVFDGDSAGVNAAFRALKAALPVLKAEKQISFCLMDADQDPDSMISSERAAEYEAKLRESITPDQFLSKFVIEKLGRSAAGLAEASKIVNEVIALIKDENVKFAYRETFKKLVSGEEGAQQAIDPMKNFDALPGSARSAISLMNEHEIKLIGWIVNEPNVVKLLSEATMQGLGEEATKMVRFINDRTHIAHEILNREPPNAISNLFNFFARTSRQYPVGDLINALHAINTQYAMTVEPALNDNSRPV